jgi:phage head maturation protease
VRAGASYEQTVWSLDLETTVEVRDAAKRELDLRLFPWDTAIDTQQGREQFARGAFDDLDPSSTLLMGLEHEAHIGLGQSGQPVLVRRPVGRGTALRDDGIGPVLTVRVAKTSSGDELLALAGEGIIRGVSAEFIEVPGGTQVRTVGGRRMRTHHRAGLPGVSLTYRPAYGELAAVLAVRSQPTEESKPMPPEATPAPEAQPVNVAVTIGADAFAPLVDSIKASQDEAKEQITQMRADFEEQARKLVIVPAPDPTPQKIAPHVWLQRFAYQRTNDRPPADLAEQFRVLDDVTVADNEGLFPPALIDELAGDIKILRPFLSSTREVPAPASGTSVQVPSITQHTEMDVQSAEKTQVANRALKTTPTTYDMVTIAGAVDVSLQFIKRGTATANALIWEDMENQYAQVSEAKALEALLDETAVHEGGLLSPSDLELGDAWVNAYEAMNVAPDTLWLSTGALAKFIDAKATASNAPLYGGIVSNINAAGGISGTVSGLRVVHVPQMTTVDAIAGPSRGFAWAEDGTYRLETDNPELAGRDLGLVGFMFFMPRYPAAFTSYGLGS